MSQKKDIIPSKLKGTSQNHFPQDPFRKNGFFLCGLPNLLCEFIISMCAACPTNFALII
jgi:hypothetical protein